MPLVFQKSSPKILFTVCQSLSTISLGTLGISFYYSQDLELDILKWLPMISIIFIFLMRAMGRGVGTGEANEAWASPEIRG